MKRTHNSSIDCARLIVIVVMLSLCMYSTASGQPSRETGDNTLSMDDIFGEPLKAEDILLQPPEPGTESEKDTTVDEEASSPSIIIEVKGEVNDYQLIEQQFNAAHSLAKQGERDRARKKFEQLAQKYPQSIKAPDALYRAAFLEDDPARSIVLLERVVTDYPGSEWADKAQLQLGELYYDREKYDKALSYFSTYARRHTRDDMAVISRVNVASCLLQKKQYQKALTLLQNLLNHSEETQKNPLIYEAIGECMLETEQHQKAQRIFAFMIQQFPDYEQLPAIYMNLGLSLEMSSNVETARAVYEKLTTTNPRSPQSELAMLRLKDLTTPIFPPLKKHND